MSVSLILEGGGYRGQFTSGVLDVLMEHDINFDAIYGVSAGALNAMNFLSHQIGRANRVNLAFRDDKRYMGLPSFLHTGSIVSPEFMYQIIQDQIDPFDYDRFHQQDCKFFAVVSNLKTGKAEYPLIEKLPRDIDWVRASATLPVVSKKVWINQTPYLDGGMCDCIPLKKSIADGYDKHVIILTQHRSFVKRPYAYPKLASFRYDEYPEFLEVIRTRHEYYNQTREFIFNLEKQGELIVICPPEPVRLRPIEHGGPQLLDLYIKGRNQAYAGLEKLLDYLKA